MGAKATITREQQNPLSRDLLERELRNIRPIARMLDSDAAHIPICVQVKQGVFVQISLTGVDLNSIRKTRKTRTRKTRVENQGQRKPGSGLDMMENHTENQGQV